MLPIQGVTVPQNKDIYSLPIARPLARSLRATSSARPMSVEVISNIIRFVSRSSQDPISQSISISHVCGQWRQISLSMPFLWTSIFLSLPLSKGQLARATTWILRSRNYPLDIYMDFRDPSWDWDETSHIFCSKAMDNIMRLLVSQASRWQSIELLTDTWAPIFTFLSCTVAIDSAPRLQTIRLARCNEYFVAQGEAFRPANLALPVAWFRGGTSLSHLRHVSLSGVHVDWTRAGLTGLQELELRYHAQDVMPTLSEFRRILCANVELERLVILGWGPRMDTIVEDVCGHDELQTIDLPLLEELEIGFVDVAYGINLLSLFTLQSLQALAVEDITFGIQLCERQDYSRLFHRLAEMSATQRVSLSSLRELSLRSIHADDTSVRCLFGQLCSLTSLGMDCVDATTLLAICSTLHVCDRLEGLTLKDIDPAITALVLSSRTLPPCLRIFLDIDDADQAKKENIQTAMPSGF